MFRNLLGSVSIFSLLLGGAALAATSHSHRAWHNLVWRTDSAAEADGAHSSLGSIWRDYRASGRVPGQRVGRPAGLNVAPQPDKSLFESLRLTREYASLSFADGRVEYRRFPETIEPFA